MARSARTGIATECSHRSPVSAGEVEHRQPVRGPCSRFRAVREPAYAHRPHDSAQALSKQSRVIGLIGAVETGVGLWYFTSGHSINGMFYVIAFAVLISIRVHPSGTEVEGAKAARGVPSRLQ